MCLSNEAAAIKLAERDNLVGELASALRAAVSAAEKATSGVARIDWINNARAVLAKVEGAQS